MVCDGESWSAVISNHLVFHLRIVGEGSVLTVIKPGDLVRVHDRHDNIGTVIGTSEDTIKVLGNAEQPEEELILPVAMVLWAVDPPKQYIYRNAASFTSVSMQSSHISGGYVYAPYIPLQVTPTRFTKSCKIP